MRSRVGLTARAPQLDRGDHHGASERPILQDPAQQQAPVAGLQSASKGLVGLQSEVRDQAKDEREQDHGDREKQHALCGGQAVHGYLP